MYGKFLKYLISLLVVLIETVFILSPLEFDELHDDIILCHVTIVLEFIKEIATANSTGMYYSDVVNHENLSYSYRYMTINLSQRSYITSYFLL